jgi:hypothetical protein
VSGRGSLSTRPSRWKHETLTRSSTPEDIAAVDRNVKSRTTSGSGNLAVSARIFPETLDFSWAEFLSPTPPGVTPQTSPEASPISSPYQSPRPIPRYLCPGSGSLPASPSTSPMPSPLEHPLVGASSAVSTPFSSPSPLFVQQQPQAIATSPLFFWGSPYLGPSTLSTSVPHLQTPRTIMPQTPSTILAARGPSQLRQSYRPNCETPHNPNLYQFDLHQLSLEGGVTAAEVEGLWGVNGPF